MRLECLIDIVGQGGIRDVGKIFHAEVFFRLSGSFRCKYGRFILFFNYIVVLFIIIVIDRGICLAYNSRMQGAYEIIGTAKAIDVFFTLAGDNERSPRLIDQNRIDLIDNREIMPSLYDIFPALCHVVTKVIKAQFVIGAISDAALIGFLLFFSAHAGQGKPGCQTEKGIDLPHLLHITPCQVIIDRDDVYALAG